MRRDRRERGWLPAVGLLATLAVIAGATYVLTAVRPIDRYITKGLDIKGGVRAVLEGEDTPEAKVTPQTLQQALRVIENRVNALGVKEPSLQIEGNRRIIVELADVKDTDEALKVIGKTAQLKFVGPDGNVVLTGKDLVRAQVQQDTRTGSFAVGLSLTSEGAKKFEDATAKFLGQPIAIYLDDELISNPVVQTVITGGQAQITGRFTAKEAARLADLLNGGALPIKLNVVEVRQVSATLGEDAWAKTVRAGLYGTLAVAAFMVLWYRLPGVLAVAALLVYVFLTLGSMIALGAVLTLPGLAGLILSVGMAVDANIIIFERIKEELRKGAGLRTAIDAGFKRAFAAIFDSNVNTLIAAAVLYWLGTGPVKGFGLTLGLGVLLSLFTGITLSRWLVKMAAATGWFDRRLFGVREGVQA